MKIFKNLFVLLILPMVTVAQTQTIPAKSVIKTVTVFLNGAQIERDASVNLPAGVSEVVFTGLSNDINQQSIQVKGEGAFTILSVNKQSNYLNKQSKSDELEAFTVKVNAQAQVVAKLNDALSINETQQKILAQNQVTYTGNSGFDIIKLKTLLSYQETKLKELKAEQYLLTEKKKEAEKKLNDLNNQLKTFNANASINTSDIVVKLSAPSASRANFKISYLVYNASWYASYDLRAIDINQPIKLAYKANVKQNSGEDWSKVHLILSSGNPSESNVAPTLNPYYLSPLSNLLSGKVAGMMMQKESASLDEVVTVGYGSQKPVSIRGMASAPLQVSSQQSQTSLLFDIKEIYTIPSNGKLITAEIGTYDIPATFNYTAIPKLSDKVNLTAKITDFNKYNLISGEASIFFDGTFLGTTPLNVAQSADTLSVSLGNDKSVIVTREKQTDFKEKQFFGSSQKVTRDFLITIKNRKNKIIDLTVYDQLPVSTNETISIEKQDISGAELNEKDGKLTWKLTLQPNEEKKLNLKYQVKYPKNLQINLE